MLQEDRQRRRPQPGQRRLRAVVAEALLPGAQPGWDYVLIGRPGVTIDRPFADLTGDLAYALRKLHAAT